MSASRLTRKAPAKLNLFLHITGRRHDGYHDLQTVFQFLEYFDTLEFVLRQDSQIVLLDTLTGLDSESDLVVRAAKALQEFTNSNQGVTIRRVKRIPVGAGLGGGSSNAATALVSLNKLWALGLHQTQLLSLALTLGADVPVFVHGRACWAEGVGEEFINIDLREPVFLVLTPDASVSTAELFTAPDLTRNCSPITIRDFLGGTGRNVFEPVVRARYPAVDSCLTWLDANATHKPAMSGTGSAVFVRCENHEEALNLLELASDTRDASEGMIGFIAGGRNRSPLYMPQ